jgi:hypothetical protein
MNQHGASRGDAPSDHTRQNHNGGVDGIVRKIYLYDVVCALNQMEIEMGKNQHVVPRDGQWAVLGAGNERATSLHPTQASAIGAARNIAINQHSEVVIHRPNGQIRDSNSYGNDPYPPKG